MAGGRKRTIYYTYIWFFFTHPSLGCLEKKIAETEAKISTNEVDRKLAKDNGDSEEVRNVEFLKC